MIIRTLFVWLSLALMAVPAFAEQLVWSSQIDSRGSPVTASALAPGSRYVIRARGNVYFGRWWQNGLPLLNDACYEFNAKGYPDSLPVLQNNWGIPVCSGLYRQDHVYVSGAFEAPAGGQITFSIFDTDYRDNSGVLIVEIFRIDQPVQGQPPQWSHPQQQQPNAVTNTELLGTWRGCDGRLVTFTLENGQYVGRYAALGGLGAFRFTVGEVGHQFVRQPDGRYVGQVKWRWTDGRFEWRPSTVTINGDRYSDTGSDSCSRQMTRIR